VHKEYTERRDLLISELSKLEGVVVGRPQGAFYCIAALPVDDAEKFCQWLLEDYHLNGETVMLAPAAGFYASQGLGRNEVRIAYVLEKDRLRTAVHILGEALKIYGDS
jgi:aspartate aminotransferase